MIKAIYIFVLLMVLSLPAVAQRDNAVSPWDVRITAAMGNTSFSTISDLQISSIPDKFRSLGIVANYNISSKFGFAFGAEYKSSGAGLSLLNYSNNFFGVDSWEGDPVNRNYIFSIESNHVGIQEDISLSSVGIPISIFYNIPVFPKMNLVARIGVCPVFPLKSSRLLTQSNLTTKLYFEDWDLLLFDIPAHGLYTNRTDWHPESELDSKVMFSLFGEVGFDFPFLGVFRTNLSGYFSSTFANNFSDDATSLIYWREDYNGILSLTESAKMLEIGIKLSIGINKNKRKTTTINEYACAGCTWLRVENEKKRRR